MRRSLLASSLLVCGLFVAEDLAMMSARTRVTDHRGLGWRLIADVALGALMVAYNFVSARYIASVGPAAGLSDAISVVDARRRDQRSRSRPAILRGVRNGLAHANPFAILGRVGDRLVQRPVRARPPRHRSRHQDMHGPGRWRELLGDVAVVNTLGVPGATLAIRSAGHPIPWRRTLRHCTLFAVSWFAGVRFVEIVLDLAVSVPVLGPALSTLTGWLAAGFDWMTDVTRPVGAIVAVFVVTTVIRMAIEVDRTLSTMPGWGTETGRRVRCVASRHDDPGPLPDGRTSSIGTTHAPPG